MEQVTFADVEYEGKKRRTRRELFLERMEALIPWERLEARIRPLYPKAGRGRQPYPLAMLRIHCVQLFYNLRTRHASTSRVGAAVREAAFDGSAAHDDFELSAPGNGLGRGLFEEINAHLGVHAGGGSWTRASSRRRHRRRTGRGRGIRRCIRRGRATSGTSG